MEKAGFYRSSCSALILNYYVWWKIMQESFSRAYFRQQWNKEVMRTGDNFEAPENKFEFEFVSRRPERVTRIIALRDKMETSLWLIHCENVLKNWASTFTFSSFLTFYPQWGLVQYSFTRLSSTTFYSPPLLFLSSNWVKVTTQVVCNVLLFFSQ